MSKKICFFSSDSRPLYKRDVFRVLSYPNDYVVHFRYQKKYVDCDLNYLKGKEGVIFLTTGNNLAIEDITKRDIKNFSIREVTVLSIQESEDTQLVHFYLKLGKYRKYNNLSFEAEKLVDELDLIEGEVLNWCDVIEIIKTSFPNELFYKFSLLESKSRSSLPLKFDATDNQSYYELSDEENYYLQLDFYDTEPKTSDNYHSLSVKAANDLFVKISAPDSIKVESRRDNRTFNLSVKGISTSNISTYLNFETIEEKYAENVLLTTSSVDTTLKIIIKKNSKRIVLFGFYSMLAAICVGLGKLITDKMDIKGQFNCSLAIQLLLTLILGGIAASQLYKLFDKK